MYKFIYWNIDQRGKNIATKTFLHYYSQAITLGLSNSYYETLLGFMKVSFSSQLPSSIEQTDARVGEEYSRLLRLQAKIFLRLYEICKKKRCTQVASILPNTSPRLQSMQSDIENFAMYGAIVQL